MLGDQRYGQRGDDQLFIMELDQAGAVVRIVLPQYAVRSTVMDLTLTDDGYLHAVGIFQSTLELDAGSVTSLGADDVFVLRIPR